MSLISLKEISLAFGGPLIFDKLTLHIEPGEHIALLGRNGAGKTTLMKVIAGQIDIDGGEVICQKNIQTAHLPQEVPSGITGNVFDIVASGLGKRGRLLGDYHHLTHQLQTEHNQELMRRLDNIQAELDHTKSWDTNSQVEEVISRMKLDPEDEFEKLSGGQKRTVLLARALVSKPDIILLDEPTNHLDIDSIDWLEKFLKSYPGTVFFVTHDRMFMTHLATRIIELDRGKIFSWSCDYKTFLERKETALNIEDSYWDTFDKKLAQEEAWIRQGVKARRCRSEGRVKALERLREEKKTQRKAIGNIHLKQQKADVAGHLTIKVSGLGFNYQDKCLVRDFTAKIMRGDKIGIIGPNGCGKTTLIRLLLEQMPPAKGKSRLGPNLQIAYYDQLREQLNNEKTVAQNICDEGDTVMVNGKPKHIIGYLRDFLFSPERAESPAKILSGGERNRLLLARLFTKPFNLLVMDEPTNDLDIETLELLEEMLLGYPGTLLLVSHDRAFLNNVVTSTLVFEGDGVINEYPGGYDDWLAQRKPVMPKPSAPKPKAPDKIHKAERPDRKISFKEKRELEAFPEKIEKLETEQKELYTILTDINFYQKNSKEIAKTKTRLETLEGELHAAYERWEYLENLSE